MSPRRAATVDVLQALPDATRRRMNMNLSDFKVVSNAVGVKERIEAFYKFVYREQSELSQYKWSKGYCAGRPNCMVFIGKDSKTKTCAACRAYFKDIRDRGAAGLTRKIKLSDYGQIRKRERAAARNGE
jgi:hypothetical protein